MHKARQTFNGSRPRAATPHLWPTAYSSTFHRHSTQIFFCIPISAYIRIHRSEFRSARSPRDFDVRQAASSDNFAANIHNFLTVRPSLRVGSHYLPYGFGERTIRKREELSLLSPLSPHHGQPTYHLYMSNTVLRQRRGKPFQRLDGPYDG